MQAKNSTYDEIYDEVSKCNRCGFCQAHCPIFAITGSEKNVARGHNAHVRALAEGNATISGDFKDPLFECLLCRACVANCNPAVKTDKIVVMGRSEYARKVGQSKIMTFIFRKLLTDQNKLGRYIRLVALGKNTGMSKLAKALGILKWFGPNMDDAEGIVEKLPWTFFRDRIKGQLEPAQHKRNVAFFVGCAFNYVLPDVSESTVNVLVHTGARVSIADNCCCGVPAYSYGDLDAARSMATKNIEVFEKMDSDVIVTECGSCSSFLKEYPELFEEHSVMKKRAEVVAAKVRSFSEYMMAEATGMLSAHTFTGKVVTYHDPCHMSRYQKVVKEPRALLNKISGLTYKEMPEADRCCGAAGSYNLMHYEQSMQVLDRKMQNLGKTSADILATECPGCMIQLGYGVRRAGLPTKVLHISELLEDAYKK